MLFQNGIKFQSFVEFHQYLPREERVMVDYLREIVLGALPLTCKEKLTYNVPFYYGKRRICLIWPASVPWGGFKKGVMLGFLYGYRLQDEDHYLTHGTNKQVYYKIYHTLEEINQRAIVKLLDEAVQLDGTFKR